jgi:hypothetical protein
LSIEWRGYFYIEDLGMTDAQRNTLVNVLKAWGLRNNGPKPNERNHWRVRPDEKAIILEAVFDADNITVLWFRTKLAEIFSVPVANITATSTNTDYGPLATFKYLTVNKLRMGIFAGLSSTWTESWAAVLQFLADNKPAWDIGI